MKNNMSKQSELNELMLAMQTLLINNLSASITNHEQAKNDEDCSEFHLTIDSKKYVITIRDDNDV